MPPPSRGALIVLEGLDRAGKSTQHALLCDRLEATGHKVTRMRFPDRTTPIGQQISTYLSSPTTTLPDQSIHLLFSANRWELAPRITDLIASGTTVVLDRYFYSGIVYSAAKNDPLLSLRWARAPDVGLPRPDLCVFLDLEPEEQERRGGFGGERYETREMQGRVRELFYGLMGSEDGVRKVRVDAKGTVGEVQGKVWEVVSGVFGEGGLEGELARVEE